MTTYVLVHGAWHGGWCWQRVAPDLRAAGHDVFAPTLTGVCESAHLATPSVGLDTHILDVIGLIEKNELKDIVLLGHSYGGMVITGVGEKLHDRIKTIVYLDAFIPEDGQSLLSLQNDQARMGMIMDTIQNGDGWLVTPRSPEYFGVKDQANIDWINAQCTKQPLLTFMQPSRNAGTWKKIPRKAYIRAEGHPGAVFAPFGDMAKASKDWDYHGVACGHEIMIEMPRELSKILLGLA
ncbi:MAG: alpha/beta fold hydrolase [Beijerinckiaceae bacterium]